MTEYRVYVGTYAKYNGGSLEGKWLDLEDYADKDEFLVPSAAAFHPKAKSVLRKSSAWSWVMV